MADRETDQARHGSSNGSRKRRWWRDLEAFDRGRLRASIDEFHVERDTRSRRAPGDWVVSADEHAKCAESHLQNGEIDTGWSALKAAQRESIEGYDETEILIEADRLDKESKDKLKSWRKEVSADLLSPTWQRLGDAARLKARITDMLEGVADEGDRPTTELRTRLLAAIREIPDGDEEAEVADLRKRVKAARLILDDHQDNVYRKLRLLSGHLFWAGASLLVFLSLTVAVLAIVLARGWSPSDSALLSDVRTVVVIIMFGAVGGALSGLITLLTPAAHSRIPDIRGQRYLILLRPLVGGAAAFVVVAILRSGLGGFTADAETTLVVAFVAGFSERLVSRSVAAASTSIEG